MKLHKRVSQLARRKERKRTIVPLFERFEDRLLLAMTIPVTNTGDSGSGSLRDAINMANKPANNGSTIVFQIPGTSPFVIHVPSAALPTLVEPTTIDGTTQPGYHPTNV